MEGYERLDKCLERINSERRDRDINKLCEIVEGLEYKIHDCEKLISDLAKSLEKLVIVLSQKKDESK